MIQYTNEEKLSIITILRLIMQADTIIHPAEEDFLDKCIIDLDISFDILSSLGDFNDNICKSIICNMDEEKRLHVNKLFLEMASCDGYADPREIEIINGLK